MTKYLLLIALISTTSMAGSMPNFPSPFDYTKEANTHHDDASGSFFTGGYGVESSKVIVQHKPREIILTPDEDDSRWEIENIQFSDIADISDYMYKGNNWTDFITGERNTFYLRVRNVDTRRDDHSLNSRVSWNNDAFTGGNKQYSHGGFMLYSSNGSLMLYDKNNKKLGQLKIYRRSTWDFTKSDSWNKENNKHKNFMHKNIYHDKDKRIICFNIGDKHGCLSYNIDWRLAR